MATRFGEGENREVSIGRMFSRAFDVLRARAGPIFALAFVFAALPNAIVGSLSQGYREVVVAPGTSGFAMSGARTGVFGVSGTLIALVFSILAFAAITRLIVAYADGREIDFGTAVKGGMRVAFPLIGLTILLSIAVGIASIFLLVPGIMLFLMWCVAIPVRAVEPVGVFAAFGRSRALTKGARWTIFGFFVIGAIAGWLILIVLGLLVFGIGVGTIAAMTQGASIGFVIFNAIFSTLTSAIGGALTTSLYIELRNWKDGPATAALAEIFA